MASNNRVFPAHEFRVTMSGRLTNASVVSPDIPLSPLPKTAHPPEPIPHGLKELSPQPQPDITVSEIGRQLAADRQLIAATLDNLRQAVTGLGQEHTQHLAQWRAAAVELALAIASKLLHQQIRDGEFPVENMIRDMSQQLHDEPVVRVRLNPKDLALLEQRLDGQPLMSRGTDPQLIADSSLGRAECRVEGSQSVLLANLTEQLRQIREDLLRSLHDARS